MKKILNILFIFILTSCFVLAMEKKKIGAIDVLPSSAQKFKKCRKQCFSAENNCIKRCDLRAKFNLAKCQRDCHQYTEKCVIDCIKFQK